MIQIIIDDTDKLIINTLIGNFIQVEHIKDTKGRDVFNIYKENKMINQIIFIEDSQN